MLTRALPRRGGRAWRAAPVALLLLLILGALPATPLVAADPPVAPLAFGATSLTVGPDGLSAPVRAAIPFSLVGVGLPAGGSGAVRVSVDGSAWSAWLPLDQDEPGPGEPVWTGAAAWLQVRGPAGTLARADLVDSLGLGLRVDRSGGPLTRLAGHVGKIGTAWAAALSPRRAHAAPGRPAIVTRAGWGADERLRKDAPRYADGVRALVVHHTAGGNTYRPEQAPAVVRAIYGYHTRVLGWDDIGYHLLVDRYGRVYEGRAGGVERAVIGAHTGGFNVRTSGVAVLGSYQDAAPPPAAITALVDVLAWKAGMHGIDPRGATQLRSSGSTRYPAGAQPRVATVSGHRDLSRTACPGQALYARLPDLREAVARRMRQEPTAVPGGVLDLLPAR